MRIHRVRLTNYRGVSDCTVEFPDNGVTVVEGDNEVGKTSIAEAVNLILSELDSSGKQRVKAIRPVHRDVGPEVEVEISSGQYRFTYSKRWYRDKETKLEVTAPAREQLTGRQAHDRVEGILEDTLDRALWKALAVVQGAKLGQPELSGTGSLARALDTAAGGGAASTDDDLWERICDERLKYWTPGGGENKERKTLAENVAKAKTKHDELRDRLQAIDEDANKLDRLVAGKPALLDHHTEAEQNEADLSEQWDKIESLRSQVDLLTASSEAAEAKQNEAVNKDSARKERLDEVAALRKHFDDLKDELEQAAPALASAEERNQETEAALSRVKADCDIARVALDRARNDRDYYRNLIEKAQLSERHERVISAREGLKAAEQILDSAQVDDDLVDEIEQATLKVAGAEAALSASAAVVETTAISALRVEIDGEVVNLAARDSLQTPVTDDWQLRVPDVVQVRVEAASRSSQLSAELQSAKEHRDRLCAKGGVANLAEARQKSDERKEAERSKKSALVIIKQDLRDLTVEDLDQKVDGLTRRIAAYSEDRGAEPPLPGDFETAKKVVSEAQKTLDVCEKKLERCQQEDSLAREARNEAQRNDAVNLEKLKNAESALAQANEKLEEDRRTQPDNALAEALAFAQSKSREATDALKQAKENLQAQDPDTIKTKRDNVRDVVTRAVEALKDNQQRQFELRGRLDAQGQSGLHTQLNEATSDYEHLFSDKQRTDARAEAAKFLYETFDEHRQSAHKRYIEPFKDQIESLGRIVFGATFEVELDTDLRVTRRTLDGVTLDTEQLSVGAREQIAVICRLACAAIVSPNGGGAPVMIDDALGWSDPQRLKAMGAAIAAAGKHCQVIVLTCTPGRYAQVGNAKVVHLPT